MASASVAARRGSATARGNRLIAPSRCKAERSALGAGRPNALLLAVVVLIVVVGAVFVRLHFEPGNLDQRTDAACIIDSAVLNLHQRLLAGSEEDGPSALVFSG
jgi:hypothetical protein